MVDQKQLEEFAKKRPLAMMTRVILGEVISSELDSVFEQQRSRNYCREMLYSSKGSPGYLVAR